MNAKKEENIVIKEDVSKIIQELPCLLDKLIKKLSKEEFSQLSLQIKKIILEA